MEISIPCHDYCFIIIVPLNHRVKHKLRVNITSETPKAIESKTESSSSESTDSDRSSAVLFLRITINTAVIKNFEKVIEENR